MTEESKEVDDGLKQHIEGVFTLLIRADRHITEIFSALRDDIKGSGSRDRVSELFEDWGREMPGTPKLRKK